MTRTEITDEIRFRLARSELPIDRLDPHPTSARPFDQGDDPDPISRTPLSARLPDCRTAGTIISLGPARRPDEVADVEW
jgi:hypothetical protein